MALLFVHTDPPRREARDGASEAAFTRAYEANRWAVYRYARSRLGGQAADDVVAETFVQAWRSKERLVGQPPSWVQSWLLGITTNLISNHRRAERRWLQHRQGGPFATPPSDAAQDMDAVVEKLDAAADAPALAQALEQLPARQRDVLLLHVLHDLSYEEIAQALRLPIGTVRSRISRGRARLLEAAKGNKA